MKELSIQDLKLVSGGGKLQDALEDRASKLAEPMFHGGMWGWANTVGDVRKIAGFAKGAGAAGALVTAAQGGYWLGTQINKIPFVQQGQDWVVDKLVDLSGNNYGNTQDGNSYDCDH